MSESLPPGDREWFAQLLKTELDKVHNVLRSHETRISTVESIGDIVHRTHDMVLGLVKNDAVQDHELAAIKAGKKAGLQTGTIVSVAGGIIILVLNHYLGISPTPAPAQKDQPQIQAHE